MPEPSDYATHVRSRLDGPVGERPQEEVGRRTNQHRVPWADRQIATVVEGKTLYVTNRFQVAAYSLESGERLWQSPQPPGPMLRAQEWAMIAMRPLIVGGAAVRPDALYGQPAAGLHGEVHGQAEMDCPDARSASSLFPIRC